MVIQKVQITTPMLNWLYVYFFLKKIIIKARTKLMIKAIAKMMVKSVPKSFENENCIVYFSYKERHKKLLHLSFQIIYLQIELILH